MGRRMALGAFLVLSELPLRPLPGLRIEDGWHRDSNPLARRPPCPPLAIARHAVLAAAPAIRQLHIGGLGPVVIGFTLVEGVAEDLDNTTLRPAPVTHLTGDDPLRSEPSLDGVGTHLFLHAPAIHEADDLGFGLVDDEMLWDGRGFPDVRVAIGRIAPVDPP